MWKRNKKYGAKLYDFFLLKRKNGLERKNVKQNFAKKTSLEAKPKMQCETKRLFLLKQKSVFCVASKRKQLEAKRTI
jgi:hypothetical protein